MNHHIDVKSGNFSGKNYWLRIASFDSECTRDDCMSFLAKKYSECKFRKSNTEE